MVQIILKKKFKLHMVLVYTFFKLYISKTCNDFSFIYIKNCQSKDQMQRQQFDRAIYKWVRGNDGETKKIRKKNCVKKEKKKVMGVHYKEKESLIGWFCYPKEKPNLTQISDIKNHSIPIPYSKLNLSQNLNAIQYNPIQYNPVQLKYPDLNHF